MKRNWPVVILAVLLGLGAVWGLGLVQTRAQGGDVFLTEEACALSYDKRASPAEVEAGGLVTVTFSLQAVGDCSAVNSPVDVMLVIDRSSSMNGQKITDAKDAAIDFVRQMNLVVDQVGVASFNNHGYLDQPLSQDIIAITRAISNLLASGTTNIKAGLEVAETEILTSGHHIPSNAPVIILLSDGQHNGTSLDELLDTAVRIKSKGIRIVSIGLGGGADEHLLRAIASSEDDYYYAPTPADLAEIYRRIARTVRVAARDMALTDALSRYVSLVPASFQGPITPTVSGNQIVWHVAAVPTQPLTLSYQVRMTGVPNPDPGWPTNASAVATYVNASGNQASVVFPVPYVRVWGRWKVYLPLLMQGGDDD